LSFGREIPDEPSVEVDEAQESLDVCLVFWSRPLSDSRNLDRIHGNFVFRDD